MLPRHRYLTLLLLLLVLLPGVKPEKTWAVTAAMKKLCSECHTMHNSQDGQSITTTSLRYEALTIASCVGCHSTESAANQGGAGTTPPYVWATTVEPVYNPDLSPSQTLAGGNFYWVSQGNNLMGHNVEGIVAAQSSRVPPGNTAKLNFDTLTCAGLNGCHGDTSVGPNKQVGAIWGSHHSNEPIDGVSPSTSYRFLNGVVGYEDSDWEHTFSATDHNLYKGIPREQIGMDLNFPDEHTISGFCAKCHDDFHSKSGGGTGTAGTTFATPWIRHPVDINMVGGLGSEYNYGSPGAGDYIVRTPLAAAVIDTGLNPGGPGTVDLSSGSGDAIITCISCHRAHGSPYAFSLRWDYRSWPGSGIFGCGDCHTTKN